ncbi:hypothetical protein [Salipiger sp. IMCC34102]|uniref:hypothetical protein n=1 Tax=Salipiger sp. IMCC34102 TaxID=2510647 RepID=UPI0013E9EC1E|nr:hypothetical protein [Salipiger sp. IMCC34102]
MPNPEAVEDTISMQIETLHAQVRHHPERFTPWLAIYFENHRDNIFGGREVP